MNEENKVVENTEETVEETVKEEGKIKRGFKVVWKYAKKAKKALPAVVTGAGCFVLGRLTKGGVDLPEEVQEAVEDAVENVTE